MTKEIPVRAARVGDLVQTKDNPEDVKVVKKVEVVVTLDNGAQDVYDANDIIVWVQQDPLPDVGAVQEELDRGDVAPWAIINDDLTVVDPAEEVSETTPTKKAAKKK